MHKKGRGGQTIGEGFESRLEVIQKKLQLNSQDDASRAAIECVIEALRDLKKKKKLTLRSLRKNGWKKVIKLLKNFLLPLRSIAPKPKL